MKIYLPSFKEGGIGGGISFARNFIEVASDIICRDWDISNILFIPSATLCGRAEVDRAKAEGKRIVLRVDGVPEEWRNRGTGWSRLRDFAHLSDEIVYQSNFIKNTVGRLLGRQGVVIYNGVDTDIFKTEGERYTAFGSPSILYCNYRKGEHNKRVEEAIERFRYYKLDNANATLTFVGNFSKQQFLWNGIEWDFGMLDLVRNKDWQYLGILTDRKQLAKIMRSCDYIAFPSFADPCPNTLIEAMSCGCKPIWINDYGGQKEIVDNWDKVDWSRERMVKEYIKVFEKYE